MIVCSPGEGPRLVYCYLRVAGEQGRRSACHALLTAGSAASGSNVDVRSRQKTKIAHGMCARVHVLFVTTAIHNPIILISEGGFDSKRDVGRDGMDRR